jgi:protein phosphatase
MGSAWRNVPDDELMDYGDKTVIVIGIADGMGGVEYGKLASETVIREFALQMMSIIPSTEFNWKSELMRIFHSLNSNLLSMTAERQELQGMGTTLTAVVIENDRVMICWSGDSRLYRKQLAKNGTSLIPMKMITKDHTLAWSLVEEGVLTEQQVDNHPKSHILTQCIGVQPDQFNPEYAEVQIESGDRLLCCTDGINSNLSAEDIDKILSMPIQPDKLIEELRKAVYNNGASDNMTMCVFDYMVSYKRSLWNVFSRNL